MVWRTVKGKRVNIKSHHKGEHHHHKHPAMTYEGAKQAGVYPQVGKSDTEADRALHAKKPGWRRSAKGHLYFENRKNRSDKPGSSV